MLLGLKYCFFGPGLLPDSLELSFSLKVLLPDSVVDLTVNLLGLLSALLSELCLKILEQAVGCDFHIDDLAGLEPDTPAGDDLLHLLLNAVSQLGSVLEDVVNGHVSDPVSDNGDHHVLEFLIGG